MRKIAHWLETYTEGETIDILSDLGERFAQAADCPEGLHIARLIRKGRLLDVCKFKVPLTLNAYQMRHVRQAIALFSKLEFLDLGIDKRKVAVEAFLDAEARCRETNAIWQGFHEGWVRFDPLHSAVFHLAQGHVLRILGPRPTLDELKLRFGPGATSLTKKRESSVKRKLGKGVSCSKDLVGWARALLQQMPHLAELHAAQAVVTDEEFWGVVPVVLHTGAISFVRKNYGTDRTTETQPTLNGMLQLAIGDEMARRASRVPGLDLRDQSLNQRLACIGSLTGDLATLDLKSASNCLAVRLVQSLLPEDWFSLLKAARCGITKVPGVGEVQLEMFSGMGNGFTMPLQTIIFWALARASATVLGVMDPIVSVYGDDIVVDTKVAPFLAKVLENAGLWVNLEKSFLTGPFRESCGADYLCGTDVRPVYVKEILTPALLFTLHNGLVRKGFGPEFRDFVENLIHPDIRLEGPDGYGDGHLIREDWVASQHVRPHKRGRGYEGYIFSTFAKSSKRDWTYHPGDRILHTYASYSRGCDPMFQEQIPGLTRRFTDPLTGVTVRRPWGDMRFVRAWATGHGACEELAPSVPFGSDVVSKYNLDSDTFANPSETYGPVEADQEGIGIQGEAKAVTFPGEDGYRKVAVYTLRG